MQTFLVVDVQVALDMAGNQDCVVKAIAAKPPTRAGVIAALVPDLDVPIQEVIIKTHVKKGQPQLQLAREQKIEFDLSQVFPLAFGRDSEVGLVSAEAPVAPPVVANVGRDDEVGLVSAETPVPVDPVVAAALATPVVDTPAQG